MSSLIELVPQSMAATVVMTSLLRLARNARPGRPPLPQQVEHLVAERVDPAALRQRLAGQDVQALDPVGHAAGGDALDLGYVEPGAAPTSERNSR